MAQQDQGYYTAVLVPERHQAAVERYIAELEAQDRGEDDGR
jgi:hypothetical protein